MIGFNVNYEPSINEQGINSTDLNNTQAFTNGAGAVDTVSGVLVVVWALVMIILRILNIGLLNLKSKIFLAIVSRSIIIIPAYYLSSHWTFSLGYCCYYNFSSNINRWWYHYCSSSSRLG